MSTSLPQVVLLFTAADKQRPAYRRGVLDALAYPARQILHYSYRIRQVQESLRNVAALPNKGAGVIVLVDEGADGKFTYFPLRRVNIVGWQPLISSSDTVGRERRKFSLELGDFIAYADTNNPGQWHQPISEYDPLREIKGSRTSFFVIQARDIFSSIRVPLATAWEDLVVNVSNSNSLAQANFVRIDCPKDVDSNTDLPLKPSFDACAYVLQPGSSSRLNFAIYNRDGNRETKVELKSSAEDLFTVNQPFQSVVSGVVEKSAYIACKRTVEDRTAVLTMEVAGDPNDLNVVNSPNPILIIKTSVPRKKVWLFLALVLLGAFLVSWDPELVKQLWETSHPKILGLLVKLLGAVSLTGAAWLAFRKLPSGSV